MRILRAHICSLYGICTQLGRHSTSRNWVPVANPRKIYPWEYMQVVPVLVVPVLVVPVLVIPCSTGSNRHPGT
jgi:hypothetical protein